MRSIEKNLLPGEQILFQTKKSLFIFFFPIICIIFCFFATYYMVENPILNNLIWIPWIITLILWGYVGLEYLTSQFAITNKRVVMREGFFNLHANELRISVIAQVNIDQNVIGQLANFGTVSLNAFGAADAYTMIAKANEFKTVLNTQLDKIVES